VFYETETVSQNRSLKIEQNFALRPPSNYTETSLYDHFGILKKMLQTPKMS